MALVFAVAVGALFLLFLYLLRRRLAVERSSQQLEYFEQMVLSE